MMQATMSTSPTRTDRRTAQIPKLSYRNSASIDPSQLSSKIAVPPKNPIIIDKPPIKKSQTQAKPAASIATTTTSSTSLGMTVTNGSDRSPSFKSPALPQPHKKKGMFGGLFVTKEPTALALEQLAAQLEAQHGELSARAIPGVSSSKLPQHVPKVNAKWDGVPGAIKEREKVQRERARAVKRNSFVPSTRSRSAEGSRKSAPRPDEQSRIQKRSSISTLSSFDSHDPARLQGQSQSFSSGSLEVRSTSYATSSVGDCAERAAKAPSTKSQSLRSPSGSSLPHITSFFPNDIPSPPTVPTRFKNEPSTRTKGSQRTTSSDKIRREVSDIPDELCIDVLPDHSSSPIGTPLDRSPVTPSPISAGHASNEPSIVPIFNRLEDTAFVSSGTDTAGAPMKSKIKPKVNSKAPAQAFLAGEAHPLELPDDPTHLDAIESDLPFRRSQKRSSRTPELPAHARVLQDLEKRPDSSRERLGLRASMLVRADQTPWDLQDFQEPEPERSVSPRMIAPVGSKRMSKILGIPSR